MFNKRRSKGEPHDLLYPPTAGMGVPIAGVHGITRGPMAMRRAAAVRPPIELQVGAIRASTCSEPSARPSRKMRPLNSRCLSKSALARFFVSISAGFAVPTTLVSDKSFADTRSCSLKN